jgi:hypothetical protein
MVNQGSQTTNDEDGFSKHIYTAVLSQSDLQSSGEIPFSGEWLRNSRFDTGQYWDWTVDSDSPLDDVNGRIEGGNASIDVIGEQHTFNETWDFTNSTEREGWEVDTQPKWAYYSPNINPNNVYPDDFGNDSSGLWAYHYWAEGADQIAIINWNYTINMNDFGISNMEDYNITSASLTAKFNASVKAQYSYDFGADDYTDAIDVLSDENATNNFQGQTGDFARFFVLISDTEFINHNEVADNQTSELGRDFPKYDKISNGIMNTESERELIEDINTALGYNHKNFTISVGIYIKCEDNFAQDSDEWELLSITGLNFSFTYKKQIDKETTISLSQEGNKITGDNIIITGASLSFNYKLDQNWTDASEYSELKTFINNNEHGEPILLRDYIYSDEYSYASFDLTSIIPKDLNITLSLQLYLANTFDLTDNITISFDNVYLQISYIQLYPDIGVSEGLDEPLIFTSLFIGAAALAGGLGTYLVLYYKIFRYPKPIRKLRKYRKSLKRGKAPRNIQIPSRKEAFKSKF